MVRVIDTEGDCAAWTFDAEPGSVRGARHAVRCALDTWGIDATVGDLAVLLVSELVTNSLRYASGPIGVRLVRSQPDGDLALAGGPTPAGGPLAGVPLAERPPTAPGLLVEVSDPLPDPPTERQAGPDDEGGRGLQLVACSARRWGTRRGKTGKTVWFELALPG
ncbi:ATP-binding protein [Streptomyces violaceoruber]|uniref:ATP-binding protein n=1 Tax=Streptomyces violaceoruber TaxID=1935 RepID=UPI001F3218F8|nr:ATP-binding protein [Streptomyces violaceoruber]MCF3170632.1 ATP-binding protein [Streptomyces violaceoruber]